MKKQDFLALGIILTGLLVGLLNVFLGFFGQYTLFIFITVLGAISFFLFGFHKSKVLIEKDTILTIVIYLLSYYLIIYLLGLVFGFTKNIYSMNIKTMINNVLPVVLLILSGEIFRYIFNDRFKHNKLLIILSCISFIVMQNTIIMNGMVMGHSSTMAIVSTIGLFFLPSVFTNVYLTYMSCQIGFKPSILYRIMMELPLIMVPIYPDFGNYIESIIRVTIPVLFLIGLYRNIEKKKLDKFVIIEKKHLLSIFSVTVAVAVFVIVYFVSGLFRYKAYVIATGSMFPQINIGDVVIVDQIKKQEDKMPLNLVEGEVICYNSKDIVLCHRIQEIIKSGDVILYRTKGDNNKDADALLVKKSQVLGTVKHKIKYVGYPTVMFNKLR